MPTKVSNPSAFSHDDQTAYSFLRVWQNSQASIKRHLYRGSAFIHPHYIQGDLYTGAARAFWIDSLSAFYPGVLSLTGHLEEAIETHLLFTALWNRFSALPERWSFSTGAVESGLGWWGGRPEFIESNYYLYQATRDPWYLFVGEMVLRDIKRRCWAKCGWTGIQDVRTGEKNDRMESFFLGETAKYLFLLFDPGHPLNKLNAPFVFNTEGHPLILPKNIKRARSFGSHQPIRNEQEQATQESIELTCPRPPQPVPFTISATAARPDIFHAANLARLHLMPNLESLESPLTEYSRDHPSISISDVRSPSNYTYFPWTLPLQLIPHDGICSKITARNSFDITFPASPISFSGPGALQRVLNGILVNSMAGLRLGVVQDVPGDPGKDVGSEMYRVHAINNILLGKDERIYLSKGTASSVVNPLDPNFTQIRDPSLLDLVIDISRTKNTKTKNGASDQTGNHTSPSVDAPFTESAEDNTAKTSAVLSAFHSLLEQFSSLIREQPLAIDQSLSRLYIPAITPTGAGAAPLPDFEEALGPDISGSPQGSLLWHSIYLAGDNCQTKLPTAVPRNHQIIVILRGGCSFSQKLANIPVFTPSPISLQLVVVVSPPEENSGLPPGYLIRPWLEQAQYTSSGLPRHHPIPMVMVGGGRDVYEMFGKAVGLGVKRRWSVAAQGVKISNVVVL